MEVLGILSVFIIVGTVLLLMLKDHRKDREIYYDDYYNKFIQTGDTQSGAVFDKYPNINTGITWVL